jgi:(p)ppGpp synthase/HD superfamily hydrolase
MTIVIKAREYANRCHSETNHLYDGQPYTVHLNMVVEAALNFIHLIPEEHREDVIAACWVHDVIEDCRQTYNDVKATTNEKVAEIAYALTNEKGKTRSERANLKYYDGICKTPYATFVKLCDRIANYTYSKNKGSRMAKMYEDEYSSFVSYLVVGRSYTVNYLSMFGYLHELQSKK